ncbi:MAG: hypothetical protein ABSG25_12840 [Bryobacteraceae bacterium]
MGTVDNGRYILYEQASCYPEDRLEILTIDKNGLVISRLEKPCREMEAFSKDLRHFACWSACPGISTGRSCLLLDSEDSIVTPAELRASRDSLTPPWGGFDWSPDASRLVYAKNNKVYVYSVLARKSTMLGEGTNPSWSPDGAWIAYWQGDDLRVVSPDGSRSRTLVSDAKDGFTDRAKWSPDSAYVLIGYVSSTFASWWANPLWDVDVRIEVVRVSDGMELTVLYPTMKGTRGMEWIRLE